MPALQKMILPCLLAIKATAAPSAAPSSPSQVGDDNINDVARRDANWQSHAKYYALGGGHGNEVYVNGVWSKPSSFNEGTPVGECSARILGLYQPPPGGVFQPISGVKCSCWISSNDPIGSKTRCAVDWDETDPADTGRRIHFQLIFQCSNWFGDCDSFSVLTDQGVCRSTPANLCDGFRVTV
ncbi:hypothetical protein ED733_007894 [Metarhizium rileyi]|uniref:Uncharacterized protein n=1 Tax=Metarhizium rileyi (strain RCEF 4871) TaxID=1649241 RepID=A0A5C6GED1_METRR|nr:hypothetical protein ED733_007894 [Metarhizium rileyi]